MDIIEVFERFPDKASCIEHFEKVRWKKKPRCPYCGSPNYSKMKEHRYHCNTCNTSFSVTVGTIFHNTKLPLQKWFLAVSLVINAKNGIAARHLSRDINVTKDTAWRMIMQIRKAMYEYDDLLQGIIEADETYIGGKNKNRHKDDNTQGEFILENGVCI
jgi:transposase-like protein